MFYGSPPEKYMKKAVILNTSGNELANQLWNYASIYAYALERKVALENPSFFEYGNHFTMPAPNFFFKLFFFLPFTNYKKRKQSFKRRLWRKLYGYYAKIIISAHKKSVLTSDTSGNKAFYLPPTQEDGKLLELEKSRGTIYFDGWLFRNPVGIQKYKEKILEYFKPRPDIDDQIKTRIKKLRSEFRTVVGEHIRQGDYRAWRGGAYWIPQPRVREIMDEYLHTAGKDAAETCFVITSDGAVDTSLLDGLHTYISKENAVYDLFLLSKTEAVIGSNSTFGAFASYYGNIPHIVMTKEPMDWNYYKHRTAFFENKYCTFVYY
jgi:hypothetical protein